MLSDKGTVKEKTQLEVLLERQQEQVNELSKIAKLLTDAKDATVQRKWLIANPGETIQIPFEGAKSLYVDNTNNAAAARIRIDGEPGVHITPAYCASYIPCDNVRMLNVEGSGVCYILASTVSANAAVIPSTTDINATINGSLANLAANKPVASMDNVGWTYWSVDTDPHATAVEVSTGTAWVVI